MSSVLDRLGAHGQDYRDPLRIVDWDAVDDQRPWLPLELLSTHDTTGTGVAGPMSPQALRRFSQVEFARLCAAGMWLEGLLISRVTANGFLDLPCAEARVMLQEVREESGHSLMFLEMIDRASVDGVRLLGDTRLLSWVARRLKPTGPEFWAMVFVGETVTDAFALKALKISREDPSTICPLARQVLELHHRDEARHISAARAFLAGRLTQMTGLRRTAFTGMLRFLLRRFLAATLYPTPSSLAAAGFTEPKALAANIRACPARQALAMECAKPALDLLSRDGMLSGSSKAPNRKLKEARS